MFVERKRKTKKKEKNIWEYVIQSDIKWTGLSDQDARDRVEWKW